MIDQPRVGIGATAFASGGDLGLTKARVTQCALSRICGVCAESLAQTVCFLGSAEELGRNQFHFPPTHRECGEHALREWGDAWPASLGQPRRPERWVLVSTSGFEFIRPERDQADPRAVFSPNGKLEELPSPV